MESALSTTILWGILAISFIAWLLASWVLSYHWKNYSTGSDGIRTTKWVYYVVSVFIFVSEIIVILTF